MKFSEVLEALRNGERLTNSSLSGTIATGYIPTWYDIFREDWTIA